MTSPAGNESHASQDISQKDRRDLAALRQAIAEARQRRGAVILAHNYQLGEVQDVADHVGDSLELSRLAASLPAQTIVFCGVHFMAETAAILAPRKTVLLPERDADCPMARMVEPETLRALKARHPQAEVVCYVNTTAAVKAECDVCCTSSNAEEIVARIPAGREILFVPDRNLGRYVSERTGRPLILWPGWCPSHERLTAEDILLARRRHPDAPVIVHPESPLEVARLADAVLSTGGMVRYARESEAREIIVGTEIGMIHRLKRVAPEKHFVPASEQAVCADMKKITLESVLRSLERLEHRVEVPEEIRTRALRAVERMVAVGGGNPSGARA